jgi:hypothetical protein
MPYFLHTWLPEALVLKNREGKVYQNIMIEIARTRLGISRKAREEAQERFASGQLQRQLADRLVTIEKVGSMRGKGDKEKEAVATKEVVNDEISRILTTSTAKKEAEARYESGQLDARKREVLAEM